MTGQAETPENARGLFLAKLRTGASVTAAAKIAGVGRATVYRWRDEDEAFAAAWADAYESGTDLLEDEARRRALEGVEKPVFYKGVVVGHVREFSDTMMAMQLNARRPEKYRVNHKVEHAGAVTLRFDRDDGEL
ncbi:MAG: terminase [Alphaproteobacteria bacterium]|nr:terminase [Alphaproteobacteria bacterium]